MQPMQLMVHLHEALRTGLRGVVADAGRVESDSGASSRLSESVSLLHAVYREHSDAEDEVIFPAISARVPNVVDGYAMEHEHEDRLFYELEHSLRRLDGTEVRCKAHALQNKVLLHLDKEERQLFPLLRRNFSQSEQSSLLWAFTCQLPVRLGGRVLRWVHSVLPSHLAHELERLLDTIAPGTHQRRIVHAWLCPNRASSFPNGKKRSFSSIEVANGGDKEEEENPMALLHALEHALRTELELWVAEAKTLVDDASPDSAAEIAQLASRRRLLWKAAGSAKTAAARLAGREASEDDIFSAHEQPIRQGMNIGDLKAGLEQVEKAIAEGWPSMRLDKLSKNEVDDSAKMLKAVAFAMPLSALERLLQRMDRGAALALLYHLRQAAQAEEGPLLDLLEQEASGAAGNDQSSTPGYDSNSNCSKAMRFGTDDTAGSNGQSPKAEENGGTGTGSKRSSRQPIDHIFEFHSAFKQELRNLEEEARALDGSSVLDAQTNSPAAVARHFDGRFCFLWGVYSAHSKSEDHFVFPALENKEALSNVSEAYTLDHEAEESLFQSIDERLKRLRNGSVFASDGSAHATVRELQELASSVRRSVDTHVEQEEQHLWPLFQRYFTAEEQSKVVGEIIGCTGAEALLATLHWISRGLSEEKLSSMLESMREASGNTSFSNWLDRWWPLAHEYKSGGGMQEQQNDRKLSVAKEVQNSDVIVGMDGTSDKYPFAKPHISSFDSPFVDTDGAKASAMAQSGNAHQARLTDRGLAKGVWQPGWQEIFRMVQTQLEESVQSRLSKDTGTAEKAYLLQSLAAARWATAQQERLEHSRSATRQSSTICGRHAGRLHLKSYKDEGEGQLGCKHYARRCSLVAKCCGHDYVCRFCHDAVEDHNMDRQATEEMICMHCNQRQPVAGSCSSCKEDMAEYFCSTCKFFEDEVRRKPTYHCQFCNLCRRGEGLGVDMAHCMQCNTCMTKEDMASHTCLEGGIESDCPICGEFLFTSDSPVKQMVCGHYMHSDCFKAHTRSRYTCPVCRKSLGDMSAYFRMLDKLVASQPMPVEVKERHVPIVCNDCERHSDAVYHFVYQKCKMCGSYNTSQR